LIKIKRDGQWVDKKKLVAYGEPSFGEVEVTDVKNFNSILCERFVVWLG